MTLREALLILIPALVSTAGGILAAVWKPSRAARGLIQHFAAGVVLAALAVELLPEIEREHAAPWALAVSFAVGSMLMYGLKLFTEKLEHESKKAGKKGLSQGLLIATFIDVAVDGFIIGAGFAVGGKAGLVLCIGLSVELLFLGLALTSDDTRPRTIIGISAALGAVVVGMAMLGKLVLAGASHTVIGAVLALAAAALLYLVTEELLVEAHEHPEKPSSVLVLFGGFLAFWCVQLFGG